MRVWLPRWEATRGRVKQTAFLSESRPDPPTPTSLWNSLIKPLIIPGFLCSSSLSVLFFLSIGCMVLPFLSFPHVVGASLLLSKNLVLYKHQAAELSELQTLSSNYISTMKQLNRTHANGQTCKILYRDSSGRKKWSPMCFRNYRAKDGLSHSAQHRYIDEAFQRHRGGDS